MISWFGYWNHVSAWLVSKHLEIIQLFEWHNDKQVRFGITEVAIPLSILAEIIYDQGHCGFVAIKFSTANLELRNISSWLQSISAGKLIVSVISRTMIWSSGGTHGDQTDSSTICSLDGPKALRTDWCCLLIIWSLLLDHLSIMC